ncbi:MAG TPA: hypothetical protein VGG51_08615 [Candidatus Cybelea sp.]
MSPALLPTLTSAEYDHVFRLDGLSDHSGLIVELAGGDRQQNSRFPAMVSLQRGYIAV